MTFENFLLVKTQFTISSNFVSSWPQFSSPPKVKSLMRKTRVPKALLALSLISAYVKQLWNDRYCC